jgi:hypothetical protein
LDALVPKTVPKNRPADSRAPASDSQGSVTPGSIVAPDGVDDRIIDHFMGHQTREMR